MTVRDSFITYCIILIFLIFFTQKHTQIGKGREGHGDVSDDWPGPVASVEVDLWEDFEMVY